MQTSIHNVPNIFNCNNDLLCLYKETVRSLHIGHDGCLSQFDRISNPLTRCLILELFAFSIKQIIASPDESLALTETGKIYRCVSSKSLSSDNTQKQPVTELILNDSNDSFVQIAQRAGNYAALSSTGKVVRWSFNPYGTIINLIEIKLLSKDVVQIAIGGDSEILLRTSTGKLFRTKRNQQLQEICVGIGVSQLALDNFHLLIQANDDRLYELWLNKNDEAILIKNLEKESILKISTGVDRSIVCTKRGEVYVWGYINKNNYISPHKINGLSNEKVVEVLAADNHLLFITENSELWSLNCKHGQGLNFKKAGNLSKIVHNLSQFDLYKAMKLSQKNNQQLFDNTYNKLIKSLLPKPLFVYFDTMVSESDVNPLELALTLYFCSILADENTNYPILQYPLDNTLFNHQNPEKYQEKTLTFLQDVISAYDEKAREFRKKRLDFYSFTLMIVSLLCQIMTYIMSFAVIFLICSKLFDMSFSRSIFLSSIVSVFSNYLILTCMLIIPILLDTKLRRYLEAPTRIPHQIAEIDISIMGDKTSNGSRYFSSSRSNSNILTEVRNMVIEGARCGDLEQNLGN